MWDWLRGKSGPTAPPRGVVVDAGIPNQERVAELPLPEALFVLHYNGFAQLPENAELRQLLLNTARNGDFCVICPGSAPGVWKKVLRCSPVSA
jgi:hypothetical protein